MSEGVKKPAKYLAFLGNPFRSRGIILVRGQKWPLNFGIKTLHVLPGALNSGGRNRRLAARAVRRNSAPIPKIMKSSKRPHPCVPVFSFSGSNRIAPDSAWDGIQ